MTRTVMPTAVEMAAIVEVCSLLVGPLEARYWDWMITGARSRMGSVAVRGL